MPVTAIHQSVDDEGFLVLRAIRRDPGAFEALYRVHHRWVYGLMLRLSCDPVRADELTQDVFVRAWRGLGQFRGTAAFGTWLRAIAVRVHLNARRSDRRAEAREVGTGEIDRYAFAAKRAMPETQVDLERGLAALPKRAREVLVLHDVYGYRHAEVAELLGIEPGTSKAQLHRARKLLREILEP